MKRVAFAGSDKLTNYLNALKVSGIEAVITLDTAGAAQCDGLLLPGGGDIDPIYFHEEMDGSNEPDRELDRLQMDLTDVFVKSGKPILGICRGMQIINVYFGGSLYQDLKTREAHIGRKDADNVHIVRSTAPGNIFEELYGKEFFVNSSHHQGVKKLGKGLTEVLAAEDGVCEALVHESLPVTGVQFHPERMVFGRYDTADGESVFRYFCKLL